ncbi:hypothetical protein [Bradyrhizobium sp. CW11]|uniref:hypothetical protein n=1 Tax=Bradyrhizobium sp. CW11 TaxID=2782684 RepID=UPI001FFA8081|nr:hypothetical protein [Bradyrhizobium sp. CW11]MCK1342708.1 hypothetical protein [Bradyrhizobium sp. CW11]
MLFDFGIGDAQPSEPAPLHVKVLDQYFSASSADGRLRISAAMKATIGRWRADGNA